MSSSKTKPNPQKIIPVYGRIRSIRTLFLLVINGVALFLALILLWAGTGIMNSVISGFGAEIMQEKLNGLLHPIDTHYTTLAESDSGKDLSPGKNEIRESALADLAGFRFKNSGSLFVISQDQSRIMSRDFQSNTDPGFADFFALLESGSGAMEYMTGGHKKFAAYRLYAPWDSYIGLTIDKQEFFAPKNQFVRTSLMLVTALLLATVLFSGFIQRLIITPLIRLAHYADQISTGNYDTELHGRFPCEIGELKSDIQHMVATLRQKMEQASAQIQIIKEREAWLDKALNALQESEKKYRTIYNAPTEAILIYDPQKKRIIDTNKAMLGMFGRHYDDLQQLSLGDLSSDEEPFSPEEIESKTAATLDKGPQLFEWIMCKRDGEPFWAEISLQSSFIEEEKKIIAVIRNIHARKMAEQELASEKERLAVTLRSIGDGVITTDNLGRVVLMNTVAEELTGWRQVDAVGRRFQEVFHTTGHADDTDHENPIDRVLHSDHKIEPAQDIILVAKDGSQKNIAESGTPIRDPENRVIGGVIVFRDVTEEKKMEAELFKIRNLESVGVLAGGIAHDFNNILVAILGNISLARKRLDNPQEAETLLINTEKAALRARDLTAQLLTFSRGGEPVIKTASIQSIIKESAEFVLRGSNVKVTFEIPDDLWLVNIDTGQIGQVIQNIVLNARQAIQEEGIVFISCQNCTDCGTVPDPLRKQCVRVLIHDNGPGIAPEILPKIFDPYFSTKDDGSGLGLAICHAIIKKHHTSLSVNSTLGKGTTFTIQLPVSSEQNIDGPATIPVHRPANRTGRILVMDDDEMILELTSQMLVYLGHKATVCTDGQACLDLYQKAMIDKLPYDLVIMDLTIPGGMGGAKAIKELLRLAPQARAIVSSGYSDDPVMAEYAKYGFKTVLVKPYQLEDLDKAVQNTLES